MTAPILRIDPRDDGDHTVTIGTRDLNQAQMIVDPDVIGDSALRHVANLLYDWPATLKAIPRKRKRT